MISSKSKSKDPFMVVVGQHFAFLLLVVEWLKSKSLLNCYFFNMLITFAPQTSNVNQALRKSLNPHAGLRGMPSSMGSSMASRTRWNPSPNVRSLGVAPNERGGLGPQNH